MSCACCAHGGPATPVRRATVRYRSVRSTCFEWPSPDRRYPHIGRFARASSRQSRTFLNARRVAAPAVPARPGWDTASSRCGTRLHRDGFADLDASAVLQAGAALGQLGGVLDVVGTDDYVAAEPLSRFGTERRGPSDPLAEISDRTAKLLKPGTPRGFLTWDRLGVGHPEDENVAGHTPLLHVAVGHHLHRLPPSTSQQPRNRQPTFPTSPPGPPGVSYDITAAYLRSRTPMLISMLPTSSELLPSRPTCVNAARADVVLPSG